MALALLGSTLSVHAGKSGTAGLSLQAGSAKAALCREPSDGGPPDQANASDRARLVHWLKATVAAKHAQLGSVGKAIVAGRPIPTKTLTVPDPVTGGTTTEQVGVGNLLTNVTADLQSPFETDDTNPTTSGANPTGPSRGFRPQTIHRTMGSATFSYSCGVGVPTLSLFEVGPGDYVATGVWYQWGYIGPNPRNLGDTTCSFSSISCVVTVYWYPAYYSQIDKVNLSGTWWVNKLGGKCDYSALWWIH
jgi:hypothetical protein